MTARELIEAASKAEPEAEVRVMVMDQPEEDGFHQPKWAEPKVVGSELKNILLIRV